ncbi:tetratricopeptide repeat protein [Oxalobacteraceae bacterium OM1]|nr:tetratricopeptide repeat protein [Oxalobacteraceae bacterium OM1]
MRNLTLADIEKRYGVSPRLVRALVKAGFITPTRGARREYRFSFNDVVLARKAAEWQAAGISTARLTRLLRRLAATLAGDDSIAVSVSASGRDLVARDGDALRNADGQFVLDFVRAQAPAPVLPLQEIVPQVGPKLSAQGWFDLAVDTEERDPLQAVQCYQRAIEIDQRYADAYVNLSCLLIEAQQYLEAFAVCQEGLAYCPNASLLYFNLGVLYEDLSDPANALRSYEEALRCDPMLADAHFNAAQLCEQIGETKAAIRHYAAARRLGGR